MASAHDKSSTQKDQEELTIVLFGKTGNGKSSVGNIILGQGHGAQGHFPVSSGMASATVNTEKRSTTRNGILIEVIDIPDFTNLDANREGITNDIISLNRKVVNKPYVILLAVRCDVRYTKEEYDIYKEFKRLWGLGISDHLTLAFTFGDRQERDLQKELKTVNDELKNVLGDARQHYVVFNDNTDEENKKKQVEHLMKTIWESQKNAGLSSREHRTKCEEKGSYGSMSSNDNQLSSAAAANPGLLTWLWNKICCCRGSP